MIVVPGKYCTAKVYTDNVEEAALKQIINLMNQPFAAGSNCAIMPDCHAGVGCVIGLTAKITDKVVPNLVGVDIGCSMLVLKVDESPMAYKPMDEIIANIQDTADIVSVIKPIYNFKASEEK